MLTIIIDAGHGGADPGAVKGVLQEKRFNLIMAHYVAGHLQQLSSEYNTLLTRYNDEYIELNSRCKIANDWMSVKNVNTALYLSLHFNAGGGSGIESYTSRHGSIITENIQAMIHRSLHQFAVTRGMDDRGIKQANLLVLNKTIMPAVLIECAFIDNALDMKRMQDDNNLYYLARNIAEGINNAKTILYHYCRSKVKL